MAITTEDINRMRLSIDVNFDMPAHPFNDFSRRKVRAHPPKKHEIPELDETLTNYCCTLPLSLLRAVCA